MRDLGRGSVHSLACWYSNLQQSVGAWATALLQAAVSGTFELHVRWCTDGSVLYVLFLLALCCHQGGWAFLDLEKSDAEDEEEEASSDGFNPGSDAEDEEESSEDMSDEVRHSCACISRGNQGHSYCHPANFVHEVVPVLAS